MRTSMSLLFFAAIFIGGFFFNAVSAEACSNPGKKCSVSVDVRLVIPYNVHHQSHRENNNNVCVRNYGDYYMFQPCTGEEDVAADVSSDEEWYEAVMTPQLATGQEIAFQTY